MFEPTRLAATHLADAYAQIVPLRLRAVHGPAVAPPAATVEEDAVAWMAGSGS